MTATGLDIPEGTEGPEWQDVGDMLRSLDSAVSWWLADWAAYAHRVWNMTASEIAVMFNYEATTIEPYMSVAESIPGLIRNQAVSFSHHRRVAKMDVELQSRWIAFAAMHGLTLETFKVEIRAIDELTYEGKITKLDEALAQKLLITQLPGIKRPTPPKKDKVQEQANHFSLYVKNEKDNVPYMKQKQKEDFADRARWLGEYYFKLAKWAIGDEE